MTALQHQLDEVLLPTVRARLAGGAALVAPELLAERMLAVTPAPAPQNKMAEQVGPEYFDTKGVQTILAAPGASPVSKQAVEHRRHRHSLLALRTSDGRWIYPTWQFRDHEVLPGLADVLATFYPAPAPGRDSRAGTGGQDVRNATGAEREEAGESGSAPVRREPFSRWSVATWVTTPLADLGDVSVADWLRQGRGIDPVLQLARRVAAAWAA